MQPVLEGKFMQPVLVGIENYNHFERTSIVSEKNLGLGARIWDLIKRVLPYFCSKTEGSLSTVRVCGFELPKFWSGKRIVKIDLAQINKVEQKGQNNKVDSSNKDTDSPENEVPHAEVSQQPKSIVPQNLDSRVIDDQTIDQTIDDSKKNEDELVEKAESSENEDELVEKAESSELVSEIPEPVVDLAEKVETVLFSVRSEEKRAGLARCFLNQINGQTWTVDNPHNPDKIFKNPGKKTANPTSRFVANTITAVKRAQKHADYFAKTQDTRHKEFNDFLDKFDITNRGDPHKIVTDCDPETKSTILELQGCLYGVSSTQGLRPSMEDTHVAFTLDGHPCFAVFDGHGGPDDAIFCAQNIERILNDYLINEQTSNNQCLRPAEWNDAEWILFLKKSFILLDREAKKAKPRYNTSGTTVALNIIIGNRIICANLADSRTIIIDSSGEVNQLSLDAKCKNPKYSKKVYANGGFIILNRVNGSLAVPRNIGGAGGLAPFLSPVPTLSEYRLGKYIIIACDGLWDVLETIQVGEIVALMEQRGYDVDAISQALVKLALERGSEDNISVMVIKAPHYFTMQKRVQA